MWQQSIARSKAARRPGSKVTGCLFPLLLVAFIIHQTSAGRGRVEDNHRANHNKSFHSKTSFVDSKVLRLFAQRRLIEGRCTLAPNDFTHRAKGRPVRRRRAEGGLERERKNRNSEFHPPVASA